MINLPSTDKVQLVSSAAGALDVHASFVDYDASTNPVTITPGRQNVKITTATTTDVVAAPASGVTRNVKTVSIRNTGVTVNTVTVQIDVSGTKYELSKAALEANQVLSFVEGVGWSVTDGGFFPADAFSVLDLPNNASPGTPDADVIRLYGAKRAGRMLVGYSPPSGLPLAFQPFLGYSKIGLWVPQGNSSATPGVLGMPPFTINGSTTARNVATTNMLTATRRLGVFSSSAAGNSASCRIAALQYFRGNTAGVGGFYMATQFGFSDAATVSDSRSFIGMYGASGLIGNANPDILTNVVGVGSNNGETNLSWIYNDVTGTATKISLGENFPAQTLSEDLYKLEIWCTPTVSAFYMLLTRQNTGHTASIEITSDMPAATQLLTYHSWRNNGATALAVGLDQGMFYIETDV